MENECEDLPILLSGSKSSNAPPLPDETSALALLALLILSIPCRGSVDTLADERGFELDSRTTKGSSRIFPCFETAVGTDPHLDSGNGLCQQRKQISFK